MHPLWDATMLDVDTAKAKVFQFMHPLWDAIDFSIYKPIFHNFNSCIPLGMQRCRRSDYASADQFQFMHPAMDATLKTKNYFTYIGISIHALRVECNEGEPLPEMATVQFQFMHSEWSATGYLKERPVLIEFQFMHSEWSAT